jgi:glycosyltransferase involved in cell wall biosynthesis
LSQRVVTVTTFPPTRCGIARFSDSLLRALDARGQPVSVARLVGPRDTPSSDHRVLVEFDPSSAIGIERARKVLSRYSAVIVQHEFGIYGPSDGEAVVDLVADLETRVMTVLHTVPFRPSPNQRRILEELAAHSDVVSVPSHSARVALEDVYGISAAGVAVLPHGSAWTPVDPRPGIRRRLLTWGLLGPGKGIERAFAALAPLRLLSPAPQYQVVGQIHPNILRRQGPAYRESLVQLADDLNVADMVEFDDSYQSEESLYRTVTEADVIVLPYDNDEQVCSGVLTEAITAGRPVVATNFPHARELLGSGAGILVDHDDIEGMTAAIRQLLTDDFAYRRAVEEARSVAHRLSWSTIARRHIEYFDRLGESVAVS